MALAPQQPLWRRPAAWLVGGWVLQAIVGYHYLFNYELVFVILDATNLAFYYLATAELKGRWLRWVQVGSIVLMLLPSLSYIDRNETFWLAWSLGYPAGWVLAFACLGIIVMRVDGPWQKIACGLITTSFALASVAQAAFYLFSLPPGWIFVIVVPGAVGAAMLATTKNLLGGGRFPHATDSSGLAIGPKSTQSQDDT